MANPAALLVATTSSSPNSVNFLHSLCALAHLSAPTILHAHRRAALGQLYFLLLAHCYKHCAGLFASTAPSDDHQGFSYHSLPHAAEAKADPELKRFTNNLYAGSILTGQACRYDSRDQGFPALQRLPWGQSWFILLLLCFCPRTVCDTAVHPRLHMLMQNEKHKAFVT